MSDAAERRPTLIFLMGAPAVGKMTVGQALARLTGFQLFHLHQVIDLVLDYFPYGSPGYLRLVPGYRALFFEEAAKAGMQLITTGGWLIDDPYDTDCIRRYTQPYVEVGGRVQFVELLASLETRLARNRTENRRRHKKTDWSTDAHLRELDALWRFDTGGVLPLDFPLLRIDTEHLSAEATAARIVSELGLPPARSVAFEDA